MALTSPDKEASKTAQYGPIVAIVGSKSSDEQYEVRRNHEGQLMCQCMGWRFSGKGGAERHCRHTDAFKSGVQQSSAPAFQRTSQTLAPVPQTPKALHDEAMAAATQILGQWVPVSAMKKEAAKAASRIEEAIRKFMAQLPSAMPSMTLDTDTGIRMIQLDD